MIIQKQKPLV